MVLELIASSKVCHGKLAQVIRDGNCEIILKMSNFLASLGISIDFPAMISSRMPDHGETESTDCPLRIVVMTDAEAVTIAQASLVNAISWIFLS